MFDSESMVPLEQINETEIFGCDLGDDLTTEATSVGGFLPAEIEELDSTDFSGESGGELDSSFDYEDRDSVTGNTGEVIVGEFAPEDSLLLDREIVETITLEGINEEVVIAIDTSGIPHIQAQTDADAFFAQGYMHARDRLLQIETARLETSGRLSEVVGESALEEDIQARTLGYTQLAETAYHDLTPETKELVDAYTAGINDYLSSNPDLPPEFAELGYQPELWDSVDVMLITQVLETTAFDGRELGNFFLSQQGLSQERIQELNAEREDSPTIIQPEEVYFSAPSSPQSEPTESTQLYSSSTSESELIFPELSEPEFNSNSWVVSGDLTTTGKPFLANDPHRSFNAPSSDYQIGIESPNFDTVGISEPGIPGVIIGRNNNIAWGGTSTEADSADFYILESTEDGSGYIYRGEVQPYEIREETIQVRDSEPVTIEVRNTVYGPEISELLGVEQPVALQSVALQQNNGLTEGIIGINRASNWEEFNSSTEFLTVPNINLVYADVEGNIGYIAPGNYPIRQPGHTVNFPVPGTGEFDWQGFIPTEDVPQLYNPESGFIVTR